MAELLTADFSSLNQFAKHLQEDHAKAARAMHVVAEALHSAIMDVFEEEGAVANFPLWAGLKESTKRNRRGTEPYTVLQDSGLMAETMERDSGDGYAQVFSDSPYLGYHRTGTSKMAKRDPYRIDGRAFLQEAEDIFFAFFKKERR